MTQSRAEIRAAQLAAERAARGRRGNGAPGPGGPTGPTGPTGARGPADPDGRPPREGWRKWVFRTLKWGSIAGLALVVLGVIGVWVAYSKITIPEPNDSANVQVSIIYYSDGKTEMDRIVQDDGNRQIVPLSRVPQFVQDAHIAAEDRSFYANNGIDVGGILRAVKTTITGETQVGGSTITQQYIKNFYLTQDRTLSRKAKEILLAMKIDGELTKDEILEKYLNTIYYGRGAYGVQTAAKAYFGKNVTQLNPGEAAVLASVINAPSFYDPSEGAAAKANLERRYAYVLDGMVEMGKLSAAERAKYTELPAIRDYSGPRVASGSKGYITAEVKKELVKDGLTDADIAKGGLRITTTINKKAQDAAVAAMKANLAKGVEGGLVAVRPGNGAIIAMYGGADYSKRQLNNATQAIMQAGSNFKPFAVLAAVREGISTKTRFDGDTPQEFKGYPHPVNNYDDVDYGMVDMKRMVGRSINTAFVNLNEQLGPDKTRRAAIDAGIPEKTLGLENDLGNVLGTSSPHVVDMASAYSTIASQGIKSKPYLISRITTTDGNEVYKVKPATRRAFAADITADVTDAMTATVRPGGTATKIGRSEGEGGLGDRPVAGKTGTSEDNKSKWFSGFVPQLAVSVVIYHPDKNGNPQSLTDQEAVAFDGSTVPANIWLDFMRPVLQGAEVIPFPERAGIGDDKVKPTTTTTTATTTTTTAPTTTTSTPPPTTTTVLPTKTPPGKPQPTTTTTDPSVSVTLPFPSTTTTKPGNGN